MIKYQVFSYEYLMKVILGELRGEELYGSRLSQLS